MQRHSPLRACVAVSTLTLLLASCGGGSADDAAVPALEVQGARFALTFGDILNGRRVSVNRPTAALGIFVNLYMSGNGFFPSSSAVEGVMAQIQLQSRGGDEERDNTFQLLTEFGTIIQVDLPDILNRSDNRVDTMNEYLQGLTNITERSRRRLDELEQDQESLQDELRTQRRTVSDLERRVRTALRDDDFVTAGELQPDLADEKSREAELASQAEQQDDIIAAYGDLLEIADRRIAAITANRELIISGLKAVDVPGIDSLGVIQEQRLRSRIGGGL